MLDIKITKTTAPKEKPKGNLGFGRIFTDHMFVMDYTQGVGWHDPRIVPYQDLTLSPAAMVFHYGQEMFEGLKAYKGDDGANYLFRPDMNAKRTNDTNDRLCIPRVPEEDYVQAVKAIGLRGPELDSHGPRHLPVHPPLYHCHGALPGGGCLANLPVYHHSLPLGRLL